MAKKKVVKPPVKKKKTVKAAAKPAAPAKSKKPPLLKAGSAAPKYAPSAQREKKLQLIRERLLRQKALLLGEAENAINALPDQTVFPDLGDQATVETDRYFMLKLRGREQRLLAKIEEAVERIEHGVYGICDICGLEIHLKRLEARPVTTLCIECKTEQEEEEKMSGS